MISWARTAAILLTTTTLLTAAEPSWRPMPLIKEVKVAPDWVNINNL